MLGSVTYNIGADDGSQVVGKVFVFACDLGEDQASLGAKLNHASTGLAEGNRAESIGSTIRGYDEYQGSRYRVVKQVVRTSTKDRH